MAKGEYSEMKNVSDMFGLLHRDTHFLDLLQLDILHGEKRMLVY